MSVIVAELPQYHDKEQIYFYLADKGVKKRHFKSSLAGSDFLDFTTEYFCS